MEITKNMHIVILVIVAIFIFYMTYSILGKQEHFTLTTQYNLDQQSGDKLTDAINNGLQDTFVFYGDDLVDAIRISITNSLAAYIQTNKKQKIHYPQNIRQYWSGLANFGSVPTSFQTFENDVLPVSVNLVKTSGSSTEQSSVVTVKLSDALIPTAPPIVKRECINLCST